VRHRSRDHIVTSRGDEKGQAMAYGFVQDISSSWEQYQRVAAGLTDPAPNGLILHLAGPTDEGFRIIDVWETEATYKQFEAERLKPAIAALGGPSRPEPTFRDLHATHLVTGSLEPPQSHRTDQGKHRKDKP
jgi:hypothetical protein